MPIKLCLFFMDSLHTYVRIVLFQGESYVWQKFRQFTYPGVDGGADGRNINCSSDNCSSAHSASSLSAVQNRNFTVIRLVSAVWDGASDAIPENSIMRLLWGDINTRIAILFFMRCSRREKIILRKRYALMDYFCKFSIKQIFILDSKNIF